MENILTSHNSTSNYITFLFKINIYFLPLITIVSCGNTKTETKPTAEKNTTFSQKKQENKFPELQATAKALFGTLPEISDQELKDKKVLLGKSLYFDNILSKDNKQSCNTCHDLKNYGVDNQSFSTGNNGGLGGRNAPTTLNAALHIAQFWDGRSPNIETQVGGPVLNPVEMAMPNEQEVVNRLSKIKKYVEQFSEVFPNKKEPITFDNMKNAIGAFERKLITPSKFDSYVSGNNNALNNDEKQGLQTFINSGCISCHTGSLLGGGMYQKFGLFANYWDATKSKKIDNGRFDITKKEGDKYVFKVPSLRNIAKTYPYFHDGSITNLNDAIKIMGKLQVNKNLTNEEIQQIATFLNTLTGTIAKQLVN